MSSSRSSSFLVIVTASSFAVGFMVAWKHCKRQKRRQQKQEEEHNNISPEVKRLRRLFSSSCLLHPCLHAKHFQEHPNDALLPRSSIRSITEDRVPNFTDLAAALAACCGVTAFLKNDESVIRQGLINDIGGLERQHIVFVLCDGMGESILDQHLDNSASFLHRHNKNSSSFRELRAVFPSTTPAALTTLATASWPGRHGMPGWDLREQEGCDYPGEPNGTIHQLRILAPNITNVRTGESVVGSSYQTSSWDPVFVEPPWSRSLQKKQKTQQEVTKSEMRGAGPTHPSPDGRRRMIYINAYNGDDFPSWYQGGEVTKSSENNDDPLHHPTQDNSGCGAATDFSSWQMGKASSSTDDAKTAASSSTLLLDTTTIGETSYNTLGKPEGSAAAVHFFRDGVDAALHVIATAETNGESSFVYIYTAHPDKHMHALGTDHPEVTAVVRGIDQELDRMYTILRDRKRLMTFCQDKKGEALLLDSNANNHHVDATLIVTADHGHVTVQPNEMIELPSNIVECLEYANVGVHGKGRHAYLHCRCGLQSLLRERWRSTRELQEAFVLLTIDEAVDNGLFGPDPPSHKVRPRMGDFVVVSTNRCTLVAPKETTKYQDRCQGAHGSLLAEEMRIPFVLCSTS